MSISVTYILSFNLYFITYILSKGWLAYINVLLQEFSFKTFSIKFVVSFQYKFLLVGGPDVFLYYSLVSTWHRIIRKVYASSYLHLVHKRSCVLPDGVILYLINKSTRNNYLWKFLISRGFPGHEQSIIW